MAPPQATQQTVAARRAAAEVRRKLTAFANTDGEGDAVSRVAAYTQGERGRRQNPEQDEEAFRNVFVSIRA
jgi:hypothetical protein